MNPKSNASLLTEQRIIFLGASERADPAEREAFLDLKCGTNRVLRESVEELLREQEVLGSFLERPSLRVQTRHKGERAGACGPNSNSFALVAEQSGDNIGRYKLLEKIGEGGCGVVYMAEQNEPVRRRVALKVIKLGMDTKSVMARFEAERQALALMDHPNIAKILDAGATEKGRLYFVMELLRGIRITDYCDQNNLPTRDRLDLFIAVCQAIQHAHQKGIIHRDIKPSNIFVVLANGAPVIKIIDFGIAKAIGQRLTENTLFTQFEAFLGTPTYTSPEQATSGGVDIDTRTDIYSLGVLLYELLTGETPFDSKRLLESGLDEMRRILREQEPLRPSTRLTTLGISEANSLVKIRQAPLPSLVNALRGDLDWIVMKCIEKERGRRYPTVHDVVLDVRRYLDKQPVLARPPSATYRFQKFIRRHRFGFAAGIFIAFTLISGAALTIWLAVRAMGAEKDALLAQRTEAHFRQRADREKAQARVNEYVADINLAQTSLNEGNFGRATQLIEKHHPKVGEPDLRGFEWGYLWKLCLGNARQIFPTQGGNIHSIAFSPDGNSLAVGLADKLNIWNISSQSLVTTLNKGGLSTAYLPGGKRLITASRSAVRIWRTSDWTEEITLADTFGPIVLSNDGKSLATTSRDGVHIWDTTQWQERQFLAGASGPLVFAPDGTELAADSRDGITLWSVHSGKAVIVLDDSSGFSGHHRTQNSHILAFSPDGKAIVGARNAPSRRGVFLLSVWDPQSGHEVAVIPDDRERIEHTGVISSVAFSPDGALLATTSWDHSIRLWDFVTRQRIATLHGHRTEVWASAFSPDGKNIMTGAKDGTLNLWPVKPQRNDDFINGNMRPLAFSRNSQTLAVLGLEATVGFFNLSTSELDHEIKLDRPAFGPPNVAFSGDLRLMAEGSANGQVKLWNNDEITTLKAFDSPVEFVSLSTDGKVLIAGSRGHPVRLWDLRHGTNSVMPVNSQRIEVSPDYRFLAVFQPGNSIELFDIPTRSLRTTIITASPPGFATAFSSDGHILATTTGPNDVDSAIWLWNTTNGKLLGTCFGHKQPIFSLAFSPDGKTLASSSDDSTLKLWNVATRQELLSVRKVGIRITNLMFSPDGQTLLGAEGSSFQSAGLRLYRAAQPEAVSLNPH